MGYLMQEQTNRLKEEKQAVQLSFSAYWKDDTTPSNRYINREWNTKTHLSLSHSNGNDAVLLKMIM